MPLNIDSYTTTVGSSIDARRLASAIKEAIITEDLDTKPEANLNVQPIGGFHPLFITGTYPGEEKIPSFAHPISILNIRGKNFICTDMRLFLKKSTDLGIFKRIQNLLDFEYAVSRTVLNMLWAAGRATEFRSGFSFSAKVFSEWVSQVLRGSIGVEPHEQITVQIQAMVYYYCICGDSIFELDESRQDIIDWISNLTGLSSREVSHVVAKAKPCRTFDDLVENLKASLDNIRVQKLTAGAFLSSIRSSWYGTNSDQVLGVCIEHPPTWTAIVFHTLSSKGYQRCLIGQVALKAGKRGDADAFMRHYHEIFGSNLRLENFKEPTYESFKEHDFSYDGIGLSMEAENRIKAL